MNTVAIIGRLTADPEGVTRGKGKDAVRVLNFSVAVPRIGSEEADFIRCAAFGKTAEFIEQYFDKGSRLGITGHIQTGRYENAEGATVWTTDVIVERADFADAPKDDDKPSKKGGRK